MQANTNNYLIVCLGIGYLTSANTFSPDRSRAMQLCEADKNAMLERFGKTCFACPA